MAWQDDIMAQARAFRAQTPQIAAYDQARQSPFANALSQQVQTAAAAPAGMSMVDPTIAAALSGDSNLKQVGNSWYAPKDYVKPYSFDDSKYFQAGSGVYKYGNNAYSAVDASDPWYDPITNPNNYALFKAPKLGMLAVNKTVGEGREDVGLPIGSLNTNKGHFYFAPEDYITKGAQLAPNKYGYDTDFLKSYDKLGDYNWLDLKGLSLPERWGQMGIKSTAGMLIPDSDSQFYTGWQDYDPTADWGGGVKGVQGPINGIGKVGDQYAYIMDAPPGYNRGSSAYADQDGTLHAEGHSRKIKNGGLSSGLLALASYLNPVVGAIGSAAAGAKTGNMGQAIGGLISAFVPGAGQAIGEGIGLSGAAAQAVGNGAINAGTHLATGNSLGDSLKSGVATGLGSYGGSQISNFAGNDLGLGRIGSNAFGSATNALIKAGLLGGNVGQAGLMGLLGGGLSGAGQQAGLSPAGANGLSKFLTQQLAMQQMRQRLGRG